MNKQMSQRFEIKAHNQEQGVFTAYGNVFNIKDEANDVTAQGAFTNTIKEAKTNNNMPKLLAQHGHKTMPIGVITDMKEDSHGLFFSAKFAMNTQAGKEAYELCILGAIDSFSIGYTVVKSENTIVNGENVRLLQELDVLEISLVNFACNTESKIESIKSALETNSVTSKMIQKALQESGLTNRQAEKAMQQIKNKDLTNQESEMNKEEKDIKEQKTPAENKADYWMKEQLQDPILSVRCLMNILEYLPPTTHAQMIVIAEQGRLEQLAALGFEVPEIETPQEDLTDPVGEKYIDKEVIKELSLTDTNGWFKE